MISDAESLARRLHAGQADKAGRPYIGHVERVVANLLRRWPDATSDEITAAWLHDVLEDCAVTADDLRAWGVSDGAISIVEEVTRPAGVIYRDWIRSLAGQGSLSAVRVKRSDNDDHCDPARVAAIPEGPGMLTQRYWPARQVLESRLMRDAFEKWAKLRGIYYHRREGRFVDSQAALSWDVWKAAWEAAEHPIFVASGQMCSCEQTGAVAATAQSK